MREFIENIDWYNVYVWATIAVIVLFLLSFVVSYRVKATFERYSQVMVRSGVTGRQAARNILDAADLQNVMLASTPGTLTDHYDPSTDIVALSDAVANRPSVAALAVAGHECGHAIQHSRSFAFSTLRRVMVPVVNLLNRAYYVLLIIGILLGLLSPATPWGMLFLCLGLAFFGASMLFALVTLPTEFDASRRALRVLTDNGMIAGDEIAGARKVLNAAAMTYVIAFLASLASFVRLLAILMRYMSRRR